METKDGFEERLLDKFAVMFSRAEIDGDPVDWVETMVQFIRAEKKLSVEEYEKWADVHAQFVADVMDGVKSEDAYDTLNRSLDNS